MSRFHDVFMKHFFFTNQILSFHILKHGAKTWMFTSDKSNTAARKDGQWRQIYLRFWGSPYYFIAYLYNFCHAILCLIQLPKQRHLISFVKSKCTQVINTRLADAMPHISEAQLKLHRIGTLCGKNG